MNVHSDTLGRIGLLWCAFVFLAACKPPKPKPSTDFLFVVSCDLWRSDDGAILRRCELSNGSYTFQEAAPIRAKLVPLEQ